MNRTAIFDTIRRVIGRGFSQSEVEAIDTALDTALDDLPLDRVPCVPSSNIEAVNPITIGDAGIALIKQFEGCAKLRKDGMVEAYPDPGTGGVPWTIGWGATGPGIEEGTVWTQSQCDARLASDLALYSAEVAASRGEAPTSQNQFDALVSFHYNTGAIGRSTLTRKHVAGDFSGAAREFDRWVHAGGRVMPGLVRRRQAEAALYRSA